MVTDAESETIACGVWAVMFTVIALVVIKEQIQAATAREY